DLARFGVAEADVLKGVDSAALRQLLAFEAARARAFFAQAYQVKDQIRPDCRKAWWMTLGAYEKLLDRIEKRGFDVMHGRVRLTVWDKLALYVYIKRVR
ncbi:MAG: squalene/phytoene synthase family protein, partial [Terriglobia bacterium]